MSEFYAVGKILRCSGRKGALVVEPMTDDPHRFRSLENVWIEKERAQYQPLRVRKVSVEPRSVRIELEGFENREVAAGLVGKLLYVSEKEVIRKKKGTYFIHEIIGSDVFDEKGTKVGTVKEVWKLPANDVYVIQSGKREHLIPAIKSIVRKVDPEMKRIEIQTMEGLLD